MTTTVVQSETDQPIELKDRELAALLAWLVPGLGHAYQGRWAKAGLYFVCIMGLFIHGLYLGSESGPNGVGWARVVYYDGLNLNGDAHQRSFPANVVYFIAGDRLPYICQVGIGLPAMPAMVQHFLVRTGHERRLHGFMAPPKPGPAPLPKTDKDREVTPETAYAHDLHLHLSRLFELGTVYTMVAGLLNILAVYDAWGGPVLPESPKRKEEDEDEAKPAEKNDE